MKKIFLSLLILVISYQIHAQTVSVSNVNVTTKDFIGHPQGHPLNDSTELTISFDVSNAKDIDKLSLKYGTERGTSNIVNKDLTYITKNGKEYLSYKGVWYEIKENHVNIKTVVGKNKLKEKSSFISVSGKDKHGKETHKVEHQMK